MRATTEQTSTVKSEACHGGGANGDRSGPRSVHQASPGTPPFVADEDAHATTRSSQQTRPRRANNSKRTSYPGCPRVNWSSGPLLAKRALHDCGLARSPRHYHRLFGWFSGPAVRGTRWCARIEATPRIVVFGAVGRLRVGAAAVDMPWLQYRSCPRRRTGPCSRIAVIQLLLGQDPSHRDVAYAPRMNRDDREGSNTIVWVISGSSGRPA